MVIFPSKTTDPKKFEIYVKNLQNLKQIIAKYGYPKERWHDCMFSVSKKGSINIEIFNEWMNKYVLTCIPDLAYVPGKCVLMREDMGPGRTGKLVRVNST